MNTGYEEIEHKNEKLYRKMHHKLKKIKETDIFSPYRFHDNSKAYRRGYMDAVQNILDDLKEVYLV